MRPINLAAAKLVRPLDYINDRITSYRLVLYSLLSLIGWSALLSLFGKLAYDWYQILLSFAVLTAVCWAIGQALSKFFKATANFESDFITAWILVLILAPPSGLKGVAILAGAGLAAVVSKYVISYRKSHLLNPAAAGAVVSAYLFHQYADWWVGTAALAPLVLAGGLLITRKMNRFWMVSAFALTYGVFLHQQFDGAPPLRTVWLAATTTAVMFFAFVMLTEPQTSPAKARWYLPYAVIVAVCYSFGKLGLSPEEALLIGGAFTFVFARNRRYELEFVSRVKNAEGIYSYVFKPVKNLKYQPGQYMEWTLGGTKPDLRGNRRYLTLSSSPGEPGLMFTVREPAANLSAFKQKLRQLQPGDKIIASQLAGSFTLPKDPSQKVALLAGGVGVTPFRSMAQNLIDTGQQRDIHLVYRASSADQLAFKAVFDKVRPLGFVTTYATGGLDAERLRSAVPDYGERRFYVSGPQAFVAAMQDTLLQMGVGGRYIVTDYFPGYAG